MGHKTTSDGHCKTKMTLNGGMLLAAAVPWALWLACRLISSGVNWTHCVHQSALK